MIEPSYDFPMRCRMCGVEPHEPCVPYGTMDRDVHYRAMFPHRLRVVDLIAVTREKRRSSLSPTDRHKAAREAVR